MINVIFDLRKKYIGVHRMKVLNCYEITLADYLIYSVKVRLHLRLPLSYMALTTIKTPT